MDVTTRETVAADIPDCERVLASVPKWFGFPEVNAEYIASLTRLPSYVAEVDGRVAGFVSIDRYGEVSAEVYVIAVDRELHRHGVGHALMDRVRRWCRDNGIRWLHVKTRGPATPDEGYAKTRLFYAAEGFEPLYESLTEWGPTNAALIMIQAIHPGR